MELVVGRVVKSHGVRGEVVVEVRTDSPRERFAVGARLLGRTGKGRTATDRDVTVEAARDHSGRLLVRLAGVSDRDSADALRGMLLIVDSESLPDTGDPDEFHDHQLVGLTVLDTGGTQLGEVTEVVHTPGGELLSVRLSSGSEALVPFVARIVPRVDVVAGTCVIDPPEGLLDLGTP
ncbi:MULTISPECIES: ribosome maturation factor RimM [unclassified Dietzia]|uniref:ribosome maturation factor RimM n=1 Tax=unclassified Dietzia TaxID=2617939 RepID=UPI0015F7D76E|nr:MULTISPECIES: ribosome maturation factor RimM [unclassified Dietzia]MBB1023790.1 ribosome maturation factor RimM [Dietzia sp. DQ12-76]MBB1026743.1 ribosome maturation factor RimM [Dietzia sp. DQ11-38-2]